MILHHRVEPEWSIGEAPQGPRCRAIDESWVGSPDGPILDSPVGPDDPDSSDLAGAGDLRLLNLLRRAGRSPGSGGDRSERPTVVVSETPGPAPGSVAGLESRPGRAIAGAREEAEVLGEPQRIGKYLVLELLDAGGQAQVYRVHHPELARELVLKLGRRPIAASRPGESGPGDGADPGSPSRPTLLHEGRLLARCDHPNLVRVVDSGVHEGRPFVVMEYVTGPTLQRFARDRRPGPREAARLVAELAGAVAYLHAQGIVHQDIKPRNVLVDERGRPRLIDFGLARWHHAWSGPAGDWSGGTAEYMSPEQALGRPDRIGPWTDVFGLGGLLYHLLTLGPPYRGNSRISIVRQAREAGYLPVRQLAPATPRGLERIVHRALAADPDRRYRDAAELEAALRRFLARRRFAAIILAIGLAVSALAPFAQVVAARAGRPQPAAPLVLPPRVEAFRGEPPEALGTIGVSARPLRVDDEVEVSAGLDAPAHGYLIALDPDGAVQLCHPLEACERPPRSEEIRLPDTKTYALTGRPGLQAFVVVASRKPLPPYADWPGAAGLRRLWRPCDARQAWRFDGRRFETLSSATRGELKDRPGMGVPAPLREVCEYLAKSPEFEAVAAIAFPVKPKD
jgi:hypothetical protein